MAYYNEKLYQMRLEILDDIRESLHLIEEKTGDNSVSWDLLTDGNNPDVFFIDTEDYQTPDCVSIKNGSDGVIVVKFCNLSEGHESEDGSGLFIEHLLDILEYLSAYANEL